MTRLAVAAGAVNLAQGFPDFAAPAFLKAAAAEVAAELPVVQHNTSLQIVPDYRVRGGVTWRF